MTLNDIISLELIKRDLLPGTDDFDFFKNETFRYCQSKLKHCDFDGRSPKEYFTSIARRHIMMMVLSHDPIDVEGTGLVQHQIDFSKKSFIRQ